MIKGLKYWDDPKRYCNQNNNTVERIRKIALLEANENDTKSIKKMKIDGKIKADILKELEINRKKYTTWWYKETCSLESIYTLLDCMGELPLWNPTWKNLDITPSAFMAMHINWPKYDYKYQANDVMDNRYIYSLATMIDQMGYKMIVIRQPTNKLFKEHLSKNHGIVINIPGHYSAAIAYDFKNDLIVWHNPNPDDWRNKNNGRFEKMKFGDIEIKYALVFWKD